MSRVYAVRGAITCDEDTREQIITRTQTLLEELLGRNRLEHEDIVSVIFTATEDLHAEFPAAAARLMGLDGVPLLCTRELDVRSALAVPRCIRILMHAYVDERPTPVYLEGASRLLERPDPL